MLGLGRLWGQAGGQGCGNGGPSPEKHLRRQTLSLLWGKALVQHSQAAERAAREGEAAEELLPSWSR